MYQYHIYLPQTKKNLNGEILQNYYFIESLDERKRQVIKDGWAYPISNRRFVISFTDTNTGKEVYRRDFPNNREFTDAVAHCTLNVNYFRLAVENIIKQFRRLIQ